MQPVVKPETSLVNKLIKLYISM